MEWKHGALIVHHQTRPLGGAEIFVSKSGDLSVATTPAQRLGVLFALLLPTVSDFPERVVGSACALSFSRIAQRVHSRYGLHTRAVTNS